MQELLGVMREQQQDINRHYGIQSQPADTAQAAFDACAKIINPTVKGGE